MLRQTLLIIAALATFASVNSAAQETQQTISGKKGDKLTAVDQDNTRKAEASVIKMSKYMRTARRRACRCLPSGAMRVAVQGMAAKREEFRQRET